MNAPILTHCLLPKSRFFGLLVVLLAIGTTNSAHAQNQLAYSYSFDGYNGAQPEAGLTLIGDTLYGTTNWGGLDGGGSVFSMPLEGGTPSFITALNGSHTVSQLYAVGETLYGTVYNGGSASNGGVFAVSTVTNQITGWYSFPIGGSTGLRDPEGNMVLVGNNLYGTTQGGVIYSVDVTDPTLTPVVRASLPGEPLAGLTLNSSGTTFYGVTSGGGSKDDGVVFSMPVGGTKTTTVFNFTGTNGDSPGGTLLVVGDTAYGTTAFGGSKGEGSVFSLSLTSKTLNWSSNVSGPGGGLTLYGNDLYGLTSTGGAYGDGSLFSISLDGGTMTTLYSFTGGADGDDPTGNLLLNGSTLYGTTYFGGTEGEGTVFAFDLAAVPEPSTLMLLFVGSFGVLALHFTRRIRPQSKF